MFGGRGWCGSLTGGPSAPRRSAERVRRPPYPDFLQRGRSRARPLIRLPGRGPLSMLPCSAAPLIRTNRRHSRERTDMAGQQPQPVTLHDVATLAGVSVSTASKALSGREDVAAATRARVLAAAAKLSFPPNVPARRPGTRRTRTIGLLADEVAGWFALPILLGVRDALGNQDI